MPANLLADENIPAKAIDALRVAGCDLLSVREHVPGIADDDVLRLAVTQGRVLVNFNRDFGELTFGQGRTPPPSVIYFRTSPSDPREVSDKVLSLLGDSESIVGSMVIVSRQGVRRRRFQKVVP